MSSRPLLLFLVICGGLIAREQYEIHGNVTDAETGEPLIGVNIVLAGTFTGTATDARGEFTLTLSPGSHTLTVTMIGYKSKRIPIMLPESGPVVRLNIALERDIITTPQIVVTASRSAQDIMDLPLSVSTLSPREIFSKNAITLNEVLTTQAGVSMVHNQLNIRGASGFTLGAGSRSLLLLDGIPIMGSAAGNITWDIVPASEIERVEIVKSGGSAMFGSGAMGGVVNIITRNAPARPETRFRSIVGFYSQPGYDQWKWRSHRGMFSMYEVTHSRPLGAHGFWIRAQRSVTDGYTQLGWKRALSFTGKIKLNFGNRSNASVYANLLSDEGGAISQWKSPADPFEAPEISKHDQSSGTKLNLNTVWNTVFNRQIILRVKGALYRVQWQNQGTNTDGSLEQKLLGETQIEVPLGNDHHVTAGYTLQQAYINADIFGAHTVQTRALYGLIRLKRGRFSTSLGGRYESFLVDGAPFDHQTVPQIAFNYRPFSWLSLRASYGGGFRSPTVAELYSRSRLNVFKVEPNPNLRSETSRSGEIGYSLRWAGKSSLLSFIQWEGALFRNAFVDLIEPRPDRFGIIHFENVTRADISGWETGITGGFFRRLLTVQLAYTYLNPVEINAAGTILDTLSYRYRHYFTQTVNVYLKAFTFSLDSRYSSRIEKTELFDEHPLTHRDRRVPIHVWNGSVAYRRGNLDIMLRGENLFQYYYVELERNLGKERNFSLSVMWNY